MELGWRSSARADSLRCVPVRPCDPAQRLAFARALGLALAAAKRAASSGASTAPSRALGDAGGEVDAATLPGECDNPTGVDAGSSGGGIEEGGLWAYCWKNALKFCWVVCRSPPREVACNTLRKTIYTQFYKVWTIANKTEQTRNKMDRRNKMDTQLNTF